ncbi:MAG TPA: NAD(P)H-binding protein [Gaiellaceae bacterium]|nr:NAD(P)H-binding protein [Gaiellaceae bacterium]
MILVTGATGHVGARLLARLEDDGHDVRAMARDPDRVRRTSTRSELARGDVLDRSTLGPALQDVETAYYLVHSLGSSGSFSDDDRRAAENFGDAAADAGVERLVYLGGLGEGDDLSEHLASRQEVGDILASRVPTIEFRASIVIGPGSLSFEMVRLLVDNVPAMVLPDWVENVAQPIAIDDVIEYLVAALDVPVEGHRVYEIGGGDRVSYREVLAEYARQTGKSLAAVSVPVPSLPVSIADIPEAVTALAPERLRSGAALVESLRFQTAADDDDARREFGVEPRGLAEAIAIALAE